MFGSARRMEQETPLPVATGLGSSVTRELTADLAERTDIRLWRFDARLAVLLDLSCDLERGVITAASEAARARGCGVWTLCPVSTAAALVGNVTVAVEELVTVRVWARAIVGCVQSDSDWWCIASGTWRITSLSGEVFCTPVTVAQSAASGSVLVGEGIDCRRLGLCEMLLVKDPNIFPRTGRMGILSFRDSRPDAETDELLLPTS